MSELVVLGFDGTGAADEVLTKLRALQKEHLIDLEDACVVIRDQDGKVQVKQAVNLWKVGASGGLSTGMLVGLVAGLIVLSPLSGMAVGGLAGASVGAISGWATDYSDEFIKGLGKSIPISSSALFVLVRHTTADKVIPEIEPFKPRVLRTSLSKEKEEQLKAAFAGDASKAA